MPHPLTTLYLLRHGLANALEPGAVSDHERVLSPEGIERTTAAASALRRLRISPVAIWTSPLPRTLQTAQIVATALNLPAPLVREELAIDNGAEGVLKALGGVRVPSLMLVGHNPDLQILAALLLGARRADAVILGKGTLARFKLTTAPGPRCARLASLWREKDLIRLAGTPTRKKA